MLKVVQENNESNDETAVADGGSLLDEIVRDGARAMLAAALQGEVAAYVEAFADQLDESGRRLVVRNGPHQIPANDKESGVGGPGWLSWQWPGGG